MVVLTDAGISAESEIPTFRGSGGIWQGHDPHLLATPQAFEHLDLYGVSLSGLGKLGAA